MTELNQEKLQLLNTVFQGIWSGKLPHKQEEYFCDTSCCVAGWLYVIEHGLEEASEFERNRAISNLLLETWASELIGLNQAEQHLLFDAYSFKQIQEITLNKINQGIRCLNTEDDRRSIYEMMFAAFSSSPENETWQVYYQNIRLNSTSVDKLTEDVQRFLGEIK